jgi:hypothetical protein
MDVESAAALLKRVALHHNLALLHFQNLFGALKQAQQHWQPVCVWNCAERTRWSCFAFREEAEML